VGGWWEATPQNVFKNYFHNPFFRAIANAQNGPVILFDPSPAVTQNNATVEVTLGAGSYEFKIDLGASSSGWVPPSYPTITTSETLGGGNVLICDSRYGSGTDQFWIYNVKIDDVYLVDGQVRLYFTDSTQFSNIAINDTLTMTGGGATGTVMGISAAKKLIVVTPLTGTWVVGNTAWGSQFTPSYPGAPTAYPPGINYTSIVDVTGSSNLTSYPLTGLSAGSTYYAQVAYTSGPTVATSSYSSWSSFKTA